MKDKQNNYGPCTPNLRYSCPVEATFDVLGGKWKGIILVHLLEDKKHFNEFRKIMPGISQRMLTLQLRELEQHGIIYI